MYIGIMMLVFIVGVSFRERNCKLISIKNYDERQERETTKGKMTYTKRQFGSNMFGPCNLNYHG